MTLLLKNVGFSIFLTKKMSQLPSTSRFPLPKKVQGENHVRYQLAYRGGRAPITVHAEGLIRWVPKLHYFNQLFIVAWLVVEPLI